MKLLSLFFAGTMFFAPVSYEENVETSEVTTEVVEESTTGEVTLTEEEKAELLELLEKWANGEIELDEATAQLIKEKLAPVLQENLDKLLANYIEESEERQKVSGVIMAILGALGSFLVMLLFTKGIKKNNLKATINNETFSQSSKVITKSVEESKKDIAKLKELIDSNKDINEKTQEMVLQMTSTFEKQINAIMGVLKLTYKEGVENEEQQEETPKE